MVEKIKRKLSKEKHEKNSRIKNCVFVCDKQMDKSTLRTT